MTNQTHEACRINHDDGMINHDERMINTGGVVVCVINYSIRGVITYDGRMIYSDACMINYIAYDKS